MSYQDVLNANNKRLQESQARQTSNPSYMDEWNSGLTQDPGEWETFAKSKGIDSNAQIPSTFWGTAKTGSAEEASNNVYNASQSYNSQKTKYAAESGKRAAMGFWEEQKNAQEKANEDTLIDRQYMLEELAKYKTNSILNNDKINQILSDEKERLSAANSQVVTNIEQRYSTQGRSADPLMMANLQRRLNADMNDELNSRQTQLEIDRSQMYSTYMGHLNSTLAGTKRTVMDPQVALQFMNQLGASASPVMNAGYNGGGGTGGGMGGTQTFGGGKSGTANYYQMGEDKKTSNSLSNIQQETNAQRQLFRSTSI
jgi:hypothetical protein